jgi:hypothetical protein
MQCDIGTKRNSKGHATHWIGYKLHLSVLDGDIPAAAILTSASLHDSQVAIALIQMTRERVTNLYDLMDAAYDADGIHAFSRSQGHVPIIDANARRGEKRRLRPRKKTVTPSVVPPSGPIPRSRTATARGLSGSGAQPRSWRISCSVSSR